MNIHLHPFKTVVEALLPPDDKEMIETVTFPDDNVMIKIHSAKITIPARAIIQQRESESMLDKYNYSHNDLYSPEK